MVTDCGATPRVAARPWRRSARRAFKSPARCDQAACLASAALTYGVLANRFEEGFDLANRALVVHPNSVFVCNRVAAVYAICGESDKAISQCEAACRMNPLDSKKAATINFNVISFAL